MSEIKPFKKYTAELIGTMVLVLMGCGSAVLAGSLIGNVGIAFAFGLAVLAMVYAIGSISGCHINPAITISMFAAGKIHAKDAAAYISSAMYRRHHRRRITLHDCFGKPCIQL